MSGRSRKPRAPKASPVEESNALDMIREPLRAGALQRLRDGKFLPVAKNLWRIKPTNGGRGYELDEGPER